MAILQLIKGISSQDVPPLFLFPWRGRSRASLPGPRELAEEAVPGELGARLAQVALALADPWLLASKLGQSSPKKTEWAWKAPHWRPNKSTNFFFSRPGITRSLVSWNQQGSKCTRERICNQSFCEVLSLRDLLQLFFAKTPSLQKLLRDHVTHVTFGFLTNGLFPFVWPHNWLPIHPAEAICWTPWCKEFPCHLDYFRSSWIQTDHQLKRLVDLAPSEFLWSKIGEIYHQKSEGEVPWSSTIL